ncbi:Acylphosphatase [Desulfarculales bacterium]
MNEVKATVLIKGKVQGVSFRAYTQETARELGLKGYVRNLPLRRVEAVFQGPRPRVKKAIAWCHRGSPSAFVTDVEVSWGDLDPLLGNFEIRH